jgi:hypothetical protein
LDLTQPLSPAGVLTSYQPFSDARTVSCVPSPSQFVTVHSVPAQLRRCKVCTCTTQVEGVGDGVIRDICVAAGLGVLEAGKAAFSASISNGALVKEQASNVTEQSKRVIRIFVFMLSLSAGKPAL